MVRRDASQPTGADASNGGVHAAKADTSRPPPPPPLPEPKTVLVRDGHCIIEYVEVLPTEPTVTPLTIALIPGAPGAYQDFKYIVPLLSKRARVIALNAPGYGGSMAVGVSTREAYDQIGVGPAAEAVAEALGVLCKEDANVFVLGHSFGGHMAISVTTLMQKDSFPFRPKGLALVASMGHKPHRSLAPKTMYVLSSIVMADIPLVSPATAELTRWLMTTFVGFPRSHPTGFFVASTIRASTVDYDSVMSELSNLSHVPTFHAWSRSDYHIEEEISLVLSETAKGPGPRIAFQGGGHNIQKTRADVLGAELLKWMDSVLDGTCVERDAAPRVLE